MTKVHVVPHTHWDREWYFTQQDSDVLATYNFTKVIETLENVKEYSCYHLDGQSSIVEDYLKVLPHMRERMAKLVSEKKLFIGPWYTQTDTYNVAAESIIRNLKYGMHIAEELGHSMMVGYLPDTFGHNAQMPTIFKGMGIDNIVFWRGVDYDSQIEKSNFFWQSAGGDTIYAYNLVHGYGAAKNIVPDDAHLDKKIFPMVEKIKQLSGLDEVLIPSGGDQVNIDPRLPETLAIATERSAEDVYSISSMESFAEHMRSNSDEFETYVGEFKAPRYTRIHKTIGSVRYDIKKLNFEIEQFLLKKLEVVIAIAKAQGITVQTELVDIAWKKILECHAHDSMGGCNSDATNADIMHRLKQAEEICHGLFNLVIKELADSYEDNNVLLFNGQIKPYSGIAKVTLFSKSLDVVLKDNGAVLPAEILSYEELDGGKVIEVTKDGEKEVPVPPYYRIELNVSVNDLPSMGFKVLEVTELDPSESVTPRRLVKDSTLPVIHNEDLQVALEEGELYLHHKSSGRHIAQLIRFEEQADDGDSYDFSPLRGDSPLYSQKLEWTATRHGETEQILSIRAELNVPLDLDERKQNKASGTASFDIDLTLTKGLPQLKVDVRTINQIKDHRVRVILNSDITTDTSIATQPFALMERPVSVDVTGWRDKFRECPIDIETTDGSVAIKDAEKAMIVQGRGLKEFQILKGESSDQIAITLFKSTGVLGKDDLHWRPGRASGINNTVVYTPDAQLQSEMTFAFSIAFADNAEHKTVRELEQGYLNQPFSYQKQSLNSFENRLERFQVSFEKRQVQQQFSLFELDQPLELSSIGHSFYKENAVIVRLFNTTSEVITLDASAFSHFQEVEVVNYRESAVDSDEPFVIRPNNSIDLRLTTKAN
ncbi:glycoside hydrolase family 38 C-terminal domain-containing protein [Vibrio hannami]|uniref:glycoside hydrolase family 38 N-terminal domain-containing protein n=1 Tax=Vibrio hannami TaxID=2717094 RepID=UPI00240FBD16|nr:glycoside hydrolase family 38 C-terminal domain-containing protein [Vibrio hannami]MDG3086165.1 glycoside hydrolase family 38 C-terminal domain-containing protein [Vibrio hannami]